MTPATSLRRLLPDRFLLVLIGTVVLATLLPAQGAWLAGIGWLSNAAIFLLFFLHGARLSRAAVMAGATRWRLQGAILAFTYLAFPLAGLAVSHALSGTLQPGLVTGLLFLGVLPTTVQSSIAYASIARGNVAASVVASAVSNLSGVVMAPALFAMLAQTTLGAVGFAGIGKIAALLLLPFALGQLLRRWAWPVIERHKSVAGMADKLTIVLAVYVAFSESVNQGLWQRIDGGALALLAAVVVALLLAAFAGAWALGGMLRLDHADRASLLFAGAHKSLATGAPMVRILFAGGTSGAVLLPLMLYHQAQLMLSAVLAGRLARRAAAIDPAP